MRTYRVVALGCKVSRADAASVERALAGAGLARAREGEPASLCVVCGCAVTAIAEGKSRRAIRRAARENPGATVVAAGCIAERDEAARAAGADVLVAPAEIEGAIDVLRAHERWRDLAGGAGVRRGFPGRTRAVLKVQDGCDGVCSYCIVPRLRGPSRSRPQGEVLEEAMGLLDAGHAEIVLAGIRLGAWRDAAGRGLAALVEKLLALDACGLRRLRLSSMEPMDFAGANEALAGMAEGGVLCPHFHLPLQSADDEVLARMRRPYRAAEYRALVERIRRRVGDAAITTDLIAGFPGESHEAHARSVAFVRQTGFARLHAFPFSPRPGTPAAAMPDALGVREARRRAWELIEAGAETARAYRSRFVGCAVEVLAEPAGRDGTLGGYTERYIQVEFAGPRALVGKLVTVEVAGEAGGRLVGRIAGG